MKITGKDRTEALKTMNARDRGRRDYVRKYFKSDLGDAAAFDLVINTDHIPYTAAARTILQTLTETED
jgi:cytidylate kinase